MTPHSVQIVGKNLLVVLGLKVKQRDFFADKKIYNSYTRLHTKLDYFTKKKNVFSVNLNFQHLKFCIFQDFGGNFLIYLNSNKKMFIQNL